MVHSTNNVLINGTQNKSQGDEGASPDSQLQGLMGDEGVTVDALPPYSEAKPKVEHFGG